MHLPIISESVAWVAKATLQEIDVDKTQDGISFLLFWSLLEGKFMKSKKKKSLNPKYLAELSTKVVSFVPEEVIEEAYQFFSGIYFPNLQEDQRFKKLRLETSVKQFLANQSDESFVEITLTSPQASKIDKLLSILLVIGRFRNNLFHGLKSPTVLDRFSREFSAINEFLKYIIQPVLENSIESNRID